MARVKMLAEGRLALPPEACEALGLQEGDQLEVEVVGETLVLKPAAAAEREAAWRQIREAQASVRYIGPEPEPSEDELMDMIVDEIHAMRREDAAKRRSG